MIFLIWQAYFGIAVCSLVILLIFIAAVIAQKESDRFFKENPDVAERLKRRY